MRLLIISVLVVAMIGVIVPSVLGENTIALHGTLDKYDHGIDVYINGHVNFEDNKALGLGIGSGYQTTIQVFGSDGKLVFTESKKTVLPTNIPSYPNDISRFQFIIPSEELKNSDRYSIYVFYGPPSNLKDTSFSGKIDIFVGIDRNEFQEKLNPPQQLANTSQSSSGDLTWSWTSTVGFAIVILVVIGVIAKTVRKNSVRPTTYEQPKRPPIPGHIRHQVFQRDNYKCRECGNGPNLDPNCVLHIDHIVPFSKGGADNLRNYQTLCAKCNHAKFTRTWVGGQEKRRRFFR